MNTKIIAGAIVVLIVLGLGYFLFQNKDSETSTETASSSEQKKSFHFVSSTPSHGESLSQAPTEVKINFDFDVVSPSKITVTKDGQEVSGETSIGSDRLSMSTSLTESGAGEYQVSYSACWPDGSCHPGSFSFSVAQ